MTDALMVVIILLNLLLLGSSRLRACVRVVAVQGVVTGMLPLWFHGSEGFGRALMLAVAVVGMKGVVFPWLMFRALRAARVRREVEVLVSYPVSVLAGLAALGLSCWVCTRLPFPIDMPHTIAMPAALATMLTGLFVLVSRVKAITQVLGYVVLENGIFTAGMVLLPAQPLMVELCILLDVFVAVFVMGIAIFHISRAFDSIDTRELNALADWSGDDHEVQA